MGIELPAELRDLAVRVGVHWPEADEDAMRRSAGVWRETAKSVDALARDADATASAALGAFEGTAAEAARKHWNGFVAPESGDLPVSVEECTASADRLDHAADQIGAAKVRIVRELVALAKNTDAAEQAAAAGHPRALAGVETLLRSTSASLAGVHATLVEAVDIDSGVRMEPDGSLPLRPGGAGITETVSSATSAVESVPSVEQAVTSGAESADGLTGQERAPATGPPVDALPGDAVEHTGPVSAETIAGAADRSSGLSESGTGPIPVAGHAQHTSGTQDSASTTAPHAVHQAWAAPGASAGNVPQAAPGATGGPPPVQPGYGRVGQYPSDGGTVAPGSARPPGPPPAPGARPPGAAPGAPGAPGSRPAPPRGAFRPGTPLTPGPPPQQQPPPPQHVDSPRRPLRQSERDSTVVAFVLHQFPIGHMPVAASRPSRQWSVSASTDDLEAGLCFPPEDHPRSDLIEDFDALTRVRSGEVRRSAAEAGREAPVAGRAPEELFAGYDPLGADHALSEVEWEHRYVRRLASEERGGEYVWPAFSGFPEGGVERGEPIVLAEDTVVDHFGDAWGRVLSASATAFAGRCLPPEHAERNYRRYRVMRPLPVWQAITASWFAQPGGGARYRSTHPVAELVALGYLVELVGEGITRRERDSEARTLRIGTTPTALPDSVNAPSDVAAAESRQEA